MMMTSHPDIAYRYDKSFDGLLTCVFESFSRKETPGRLLTMTEPLPLFAEERVIVTDDAKSHRVWTALEKRLSRLGTSALVYSWHADSIKNIDETIFRYIHKAFSTNVSIEKNFADYDVLEVTNTMRKVSHERLRMMQFVRFQKTIDGIYVAVFEPIYNVLPLAEPHFEDRFSDQKWLVYDLKRSFGYYYDMKTVTEITLPDMQEQMFGGFLKDELLDKDDKMFQKLWKTYFEAVSIKERINPRKQLKDMPRRYWKHLIEKR